MRTIAWTAGLLIGALVTSAGNAAEDLRIGAASVVITPPAGTPMAGYYFERAAEGVHDDLFAKGSSSSRAIPGRRWSRWT